MGIFGLLKISIILIIVYMTFNYYSD